MRVFAVIAIVILLTTSLALADAPVFYEMNIRLLKGDKEILELRNSPYGGQPGMSGNVPANKEAVTGDPLVFFGPALDSDPLAGRSFESEEWWTMPLFLSGATKEFEFFGVHYWIYCPGADRFEVLFLSAPGSAPGFIPSTSQRHAPQEIVARFSAPME